jgi:general secretion pathway protein D
MRKLILITLVGSGVCLSSWLARAQTDSTDAQVTNEQADAETSTNVPPEVLEALPAQEAPEATEQAEPAQPDVQQPAQPSPPAPDSSGQPAALAPAPTSTPSVVQTPPPAAPGPAAAPTTAKPAPAPAPAAPAPTAPPKETIGTIDFQGTPVQAVLEYYSHLTKRSIISAPNLAGTIYFRSQTDLTRDEAIQALDTVLALNGIAAVPLGEKFLKVVQIATAKQEGVTVEPELHALPPADTLVTQIIGLKFAEVNDVVGAVQPYMHAYGQLIPLPKSNALLITDTGANINQMLEILKYVDQPSALRMQTKIYVLQHAKAADVLQRLQSIITETQQLGARAAAPQQPVRRVPPRPGQPTAATSEGEESVIEGKVILTADERTNKLFILSRPSNFDFFDELIAELDAKVEPDVVIKVFNLDYAPAEDVASLINALVTGGTLAVTRRASTGGRTSVSTPPPAPTPVALGGGGGGANAAGGFLQFAEGVRILPDPRTNSMLVMATKEDMARIEELIKSVDTPVAQVLIEVVIAEVNLDNNLDVEVSAFKRPFQEGQVKQAGGYINKTPTPSDIITSVLGSNTIQAAALPAGGLTWFLSFQNWKLDAVIRAMSSSSRFKVLSTPIVQTMHNQEADIIVGESRPVPVSTVSSVVGSSGTLATGQLNSNIEYKDIAIELKVTPRVNPGGYVTMDIEQKVNDVGGQVSFNGTDVPIITKREAKSSVIVRNQGTIVLGGLIKESKTVIESKVPFLGDIPFFGTAFKGKSTIKSRNELILFIRPTVMRNQAEAVAEAIHRTDMLKAGKELNLNEQFLSGPAADGQPHAPANDASPSTTESISGDQSSNSTSPTSDETDRYTAKIKALQDQMQPSAQ